MSKKEDFPPRPLPPTRNQVLEDLENATVDDPVFEGVSHSYSFDPLHIQPKCNMFSQQYLPKKFTEDPRLDAESFTAAEDFMVSHKKLQFLHSLLSEQKEELEKKCAELELMLEEIKSQAIDV